jgi:hypothetical protein
MQKVDNHGANAEAAYPLEGSSTVDMTSMFGESGSAGDQNW